MIAEIDTFLGPVKWHRAVRRVQFGAQISLDSQGPTPSHLPKERICPHFCSEYLVDFHVPTTQNYYLTGAIISETHITNTYIFKTTMNVSSTGPK